MATTTQVPGCDACAGRWALSDSQDKARWMLAERLSGINLSMVLGALIGACEEVTVIWGGSALLGGTIGGGIGIAVGGIGVAPGAVLGAGMGAQVGLWILGFLGLKSLIEDLGTAVPEVLRLYEAGFRTAWGRLDDGARSCRATAMTSLASPERRTASRKATCC